MEYTKEYFIEKFESIPVENWTKLRLTHPEKLDCHCALGHCGVRILADEHLTEEARALSILLHKSGFQPTEAVYSINDAGGGGGEEAKENILNALKAL